MENRNLRRGPQSPRTNDLLLMLDLDANLFALVSEEGVYVPDDAVCNHAEICIDCGCRPDGCLGEDRRLDRAPPHLRLHRFSALEGYCWLNGELKVVDGAFLRVFVVELAGDAVLFEFEGCGGLGCGLGYGLPVQIDRCAALGMSPRPSQFVAQESGLDSRTQATS